MGNFCRLPFWPLLLGQELLHLVPTQPWQHCQRTMAYLLLEVICRKDQDIGNSFVEILCSGTHLYLLPRLCSLYQNNFLGIFSSENHCFYFLVFLAWVLGGLLWVDIHIFTIALSWCYPLSPILLSTCAKFLILSVKEWFSCIASVMTVLEIPKRFSL